NFNTSVDLPDVPNARIEFAPPETDDLLKMPLQEAVRELKIRMVNRALNSARHNQKKAANIVGLSYHQFRGLYRALKNDIQ
ncbi:MAG: AAA family ATPase, partial [Desulfobacteraceae bacterium 4572_187]